MYQEKKQFKSPLKTPPQVLTPARPDRGNELVHSVSFYRRMQAVSAVPCAHHNITHAAVRNIVNGKMIRYFENEVKVSLAVIYYR